MSRAPISIICLRRRQLAGSPERAETASYGLRGFATYRAGRGIFEETLQIPQLPRMISAVLRPDVSPPSNTKATALRREEARQAASGATDSLPAGGILGKTRSEQQSVLRGLWRMPSDEISLRTRRVSGRKYRLRQVLGPATGPSLPIASLLPRPTFDQLPAARRSFFTLPHGWVLAVLSSRRLQPGCDPAGALRRRLDLSSPPHREPGTTFDQSSQSVRQSAGSVRRLRY